jgi:hypothetical protein
MYIKNMASIYQNLHTDKQYKAACGLSVLEFESLFLIFDKLYFAKMTNPYLKDKQPVLSDKREALFFILHYYKSYPTLENMGLYFGFSLYTVSQYIERLKPALKIALSQKEDLKAVIFKDQAAFDKVFENVDEIYIDVTEIPVERPQDKLMQANKYSGKKKHIPLNGS